MQYREEGDKAYLKVLCEETGGNLIRAAAIAGLTKINLVQILRRYGLGGYDKLVRATCRIKGCGRFLRAHNMSGLCTTCRYKGETPNGEVEL